MKKNKNRNQVVIGVLVAIVILGLLYKLVSNLAFSFAALLSVAIILIAIEYLFYMKNAEDVDVDTPRRRFATMLVGCFGLFAIFTMSNYFYPPMEVFSNNDHHAIAVEGIETTNNSLLLAADDQNAFFDDRTMEGSMELCDISAADSSATLRIRGAGVPIYGTAKEKGEFYYVAVEGQENIHSWQPCDHLELVNGQNQSVARIRVNYDSKLNYSHFRRDWHCNYIIEYTDANSVTHTDTSAYKGVIRTRYSLGKLFPGIGILNGVDLDKIELLRPKARMTASSKDDKNLSASPFLISYSKDSGLREIRSGNTSTQIGRECDIPIRLDGESRFIGLKSRIPGFMLTADTLGNTAIRYRMPMYRYLSTEGYEKGENGYYTFMLATTLVDESGQVNSQIPQNILLYDVFDNVGNRFQMTPQFMSFQRGHTLDSLELIVTGSDNNEKSIVHAGERLPAVATSDSGTEWIVSLDNFRDPSLGRPSKIAAPQSAVKFLLFMLLITILCCFSLSLPNPKHKKSYDHTCIEPIAYIIFLSLLAIRLTLLWRTSVFPPVNGISTEEFNKWRTGDNMFNLICWVSFGFVGLIFLIERWGWGFEKENHIKWLRWFNLNHYIAGIGAFEPSFTKVILNDKETSQVWWQRIRDEIFVIHNLLWPQGRRVQRLAVCGALYVIALVLGLASSSPFLHVGLPVIVYFITDVTINIQVGSKMTDANNNSYAYFWQQLINALVASAIMFILDHGYGLVFFMFSLVATIFRLYELWGVNVYNRKEGEGIRLKGVLILAIVILIGLFFMRNIFINLVTGGVGFLLITALVIALFVALLIWTINGWRKYFAFSLIMVTLSAGATIGAGWLFRQMVDNKPTGYRVMVLDDEPSRVLGKTATPPDMTKFLNASLNDWILEENLQRGKDVNSFIGEKGRGYFKLQPHSNVGVSWMTQLTDLSVSRFIIAEQSNLIPPLLILLFLLMELVGFAFPADRRWARSLLIQIPLLLAVQSLMVWMAVTRRFIFIGQDFPMISLLSRVNLCISILEFFIWILTAIIEHKDSLFIIKDKELRSRMKNPPGHDELTELEGYLNGDRNNNYYRYIWRSTPFFGTGLLILFVCIIAFGQSEKHFVGKEKFESTYDVTACVDAVNKLVAEQDADIINIESLFSEYQDSLIVSINRNRPRNQKIYDITRLGTPQGILKGFCDSIGYSVEDKDAVNAITSVFKQDKEYGTFAQATFNDFLTRKMYRNDVDELIYLVKRRFVPEGGSENVRYSFGVTSNYFCQRLPRRIDKSWRGSVTTEAVSKDNGIARYSEGNVVLYTIPASWTKDHHQALVVKPSTNRYSVVGKYEPRPLARNEAYYLSEGEVLTGRNVPNLSKYGTGNYLARNVFINSQAQFIYPMQSSLYWARPLAEQTGSYMKHNMEEAKNKTDFNTIMESNAEVTLSIDLTRNIVNAIEQTRPELNVAVVVADGDGKVRALVDHKKHRYVINPNDARRIEFVEDSLKREGLLNFGKEAERYFGNKAILHLDNGPGSSQKPIVWTAVSSQFNGWNWNDLQLADINSNLINRNGKYFDATHFAGARVKRTHSGRHFSSIATDEGSGVAPVKLRDYMRESSNYYNAIMVYLGSHTHAELAEGRPANNHMFTRKSNEWISENREDHKKEYLEELFPLVRYGNAVYSFSSPLSRQNVQDGILLDGLSQNFGLPSSYSKDRSSNLHCSMNDDKRIANYYAFPQFSYFNNRIREGSKEIVATEGVKMTAIGKNSVWLVSPLQMAEMFGRMISFNSNYSLTIDPTPKKPYQAFSTDGDANDYLNMRNQNFIPGLNEVYTAVGGTAAGNRIYNKISSNLGNYFIYGKTGTIDGKTDGKSVEDHLLAVIITNRDLATMNNVHDFEDENFRFYIIYIADFEHKGGWLSVDPAIINTVLQSKEFINYMEGE